jgi:hypothetical protein
MVEGLQLVEQSIIDEIVWQRKCLNTFPPFRVSGIVESVSAPISESVSTQQIISTMAACVVVDLWQMVSAPLTTLSIISNIYMCTYPGWC